jgi:hypothetical protein
MTTAENFDAALQDVDTGVYAKRRVPGSGRTGLRPAVTEQERLLRESRIDQACWGLHEDCSPAQGTMCPGYRSHLITATRLIDLLFPPRII